MIDTMGSLKRTHYCAEVTRGQVGDEVVVCGFAARQRDLGNLIFIDLRDRTGIVQLAFDDQTSKEVFDKAFSVRGEFVLMAKGIVRKRQSVNKELENGDVELFVSDLRILSKAATPPFEITDETNAKEELRLRYRYLDLRRPTMQNTLMLRHKIVAAAREYYDRNGFMEIETPILIKSTPEGARDYLVPSRVHPGKFFALPQSPQLYKQLLMLSGCDRYMQIARCFRDEDLRADRQPEFTQIDLEMSFVTEDDVMQINEGFLASVFKGVLGEELSLPLPRLTYREAMERYGSDKPDTRFEMELCDVTALVKDCGFSVFSSVAAAGGRVMGIVAKGAAEKLSRKEIDKLTEFVKTYRAKGLAYTRLLEGAESSSFEKFLTEEEILAIRTQMGAETGDVLLLVADANTGTVQNSLGQLRCKVAQQLNLIPAGSHQALWVTDFPLFEYDEEDDRFVAKHHPFTSPKDEDIDKLQTDKGNVLAKAYDLVLDGCEIGGGSIRINNPEIQAKMFDALGMSEEEAKDKFGFLLDAFRYGAPPHGGMAFGLDRLVMLMLQRDSIRDVIAFPKVQNASELMTSCPSEVGNKQMKELHIQFVPEQKER